MPHYLNLQFIDAAVKGKKDPNKHKITVESIYTEQLGVISGTKGSEGSLTTVYGRNSSGKKVAFYVSKSAAKGLKEGGAYEFSLSENRLEPYDYQEASKERKTFGFCKKKPQVK